MRVCRCACVCMCVCTVPASPPFHPTQPSQLCDPDPFLMLQGKEMRAGHLLGAVVFFFKKPATKLRPAGAWCAAAGNALANRQSKAVEGGPRDR